MNGHELAMALRAAYLAMHRSANATLASIGITANQFVVLAALSEGDAVTQRELVSRTSSDRNTLRAMLVLLENRGLIERRPHPSDGRARGVSLSRRGRSVLQTAWRRSDALRERMLATMTPQEVASLVTRLNHLSASMSQEQIHSPHTKCRRTKAAC
jgi:DNA-binding MarR family transcriptional regulator